MSRFIFALISQHKMKIKSKGSWWW